MNFTKNDIFEYAFGNNNGCAGPDFLTGDAGGDVDYSMTKQEMVDGLRACLSVEHEDTENLDEFLEAIEDPATQDALYAEFKSREPDAE